jgi:hypothetical protein
MKYNDHQIQIVGTRFCNRASEGLGWALDGLLRASEGLGWASEGL